MPAKVLVYVNGRGTQAVIKKILTSRQASRNVPSRRCELTKLSHLLGQIRMARLAQAFGPGYITSFIRSDIMFCISARD